MAWASQRSKRSGQGGLRLVVRAGRHVDGGRELSGVGLDHRDRTVAGEVAALGIDNDRYADGPAGGDHRRRHAPPLA